MYLHFCNYILFIPDIIILPLLNSHEIRQSLEVIFDIGTGETLYYSVAPYIPKVSDGKWITYDCDMTCLEVEVVIEAIYQFDHKMWFFSRNIDSKVVCLHPFNYLWFVGTS
jgi:hypothetical protein